MMKLSMQKRSVLQRVWLSTALYICLSIGGVIYAQQQTLASVFDLGLRNFTSLGERSNISLGVITDVAQDQQGFIWFGTQVGIARYDGYQLDVFQHDPRDGNSLSGNYVFSVLPTVDGSVWAGTYGDGLTRFISAESRFERFYHQEDNPNSLSDNIIRTLADSGLGYIFVGTNNGLDLLDMASGAVARLGPVTGCESVLKDGKIRSLLFDANSTLWVGTLSGLCRITFDFSSVNISDGAPDTSGEEIAEFTGQTIFRLFKDKYGKIWAGTREHGAAYFEPSTPDIHRIQYQGASKKGLSNNFVMGFAQPHDREIWIATNGGGITIVDAISGEVLKHVRHDDAIESSVNSDNVSVLLVDQSGLLWVGNWGAGVNLYNPHNALFRNLKHSPNDPASISAHDISTLYELKNGDIWVGSRRNGIDIISVEDGLIGGFRAGESGSFAPNDSDVNAILQTSDNTLWVATSVNGLHHFDADQQRFVSHDLSPYLASKSVANLYEYPKGVLWASSTAGTTIIDIKTKRSIPHPTIKNFDLLAQKDVRTFAVDGEQRLWIGTATGLYVVSPANNEIVAISKDSGTTETLSHSRINNLLIDSRGRLLVSTGLGVDRLTSYQGQTAIFESLDRTVGRPPRASGDLMEDRFGRIWDWRGWIDPANKTFQELDKKDGYDAGIIWSQSYLKTQDGTFLFGGTEGVLLVRPEQFKPWVYQPKVAIEAMRVNNEPYNISDDIRLPSSTSSISVDFTAFDYTAPELVNYAYRLIGFDEDWIETDASNRRATYTNLPPGHYRLDIKATNRKGLWSEHQLNLAITQLPSWYQTWWAKLTFLVVIALILHLLFQWRLRQLTRQKATLDKLVKSRTENISLLGIIGQEITSSLDLEEILQQVYTHVNELMTAEIFGIGLYNADKQEIEYKLAIANGHRYKPYKRDAKNKNQLPVWCMENNKPVFINDIHQELALYIDHFDEKTEFHELDDGSKAKKPVSIIYLPMAIENDVIGCITVQSFERNAYTVNDMEMLRTIANYTAIALDNADSHKQLATALEDLQQTQKQLVQQEKMAGLGTLTAGVMHEINNPTNFTHASLYNLKNKHNELFEFLHQLAGGNKADPEVLKLFTDRRKELEEIIDIAEEGTNRIKKIVSDLSNFSRIDKGEKKPANIRALINSSVSLIHTKYPHIKFNCNGVSDQLVLCYQSKLSQVLLNLFVNGCQAIEFAQQDNPEIEGIIKVETHTEDNKLTIVIADNGCGMDDKTLQKVFEPFFTTKEVGTGTGLGMSISFSIMEEHGGKMQVTSQLRLGTQISLQLPIED